MMKDFPKTEFSCSVDLIKNIIYLFEATHFWSQRRFSFLGKLCYYKISLLKIICLEYSNNHSRSFITVDSDYFVVTQSGLKIASY